MDHGRRLLALGIGLLASATISWGQGFEKYHGTGFFLGRSVLVFGSHETRDTWGISHAFARPDRRISHRGTPGQLVYEGYFEHNTNFGDLEVETPYQTGAIGGLAIARWFRSGMYFDLGFGVQVQQYPGKDLPNYINTTPMLGFGWVAKVRGRDMLLGIRFLHISNAGTNTHNPGQNQVLFYANVLTY